MILYLSGTGNTRWVAESIARMTGDERVVDVASVCSQPLHVQLNPGEPLGIFFPFTVGVRRCCFVACCQK